MLVPSFASPASVMLLILVICLGRYLHALISATNSATVFLTSSSVNSNSAATRFASA